MSAKILKHVAKNAFCTTTMTDVPSRQIALFGGSFNPPHMCHSLATLWVLQTQPVDEVWWIPTFQHAFDKDLVDFDQRLQMCELATTDLPRVRVDDVERQIGGESRTIDTVEALRKRHENTDFWLIIGADILQEIHRWKDWQGLMERVGLIVVGRRGYERNEPAVYDVNDTDVVDSLDMELPDVSSTRIRDALRECDYESVRPWIPRPVLAFIAEHRLYLGGDCQ